MTVLARRILLAALLLFPAAGARAQQVGTPPQNSPFRDLEFRQELSFLGGYYLAGKDPAGVAPQDGPMVALRYDFRLGGPAYMYVRTQYVASERTVKDPRLPEETRVLRTESVPLFMADIGAALSLTGFKSWHGIMPYVGGGIGIATNFESQGDEGSWRFGTPFMITLGAGAKWTVGQRWHVRGDITNDLYQIKYPSIYYDLASDGTSLLEPDDPRNLWKANWGLQIGLSYQLFR